MVYAEPRAVERAEDCWFYHVMDLPGLGVTPNGHWDLRGRLLDYLGHVDVEGKRVLDVGAASGFLTFEMEKRGADVVSFDADGAQRIYLLPLAGSLFTTDRAEWIAKYGEGGIETMKNAYWMAHRLLSSRARAFYGDVYNLPASIGEFDIAVIGQILVHLSDPVRALASVLSRCRERIIITEGMSDDDEPVARLRGSKSNGDQWSWWCWSVALYRQVLEMAGWEIERIERNRYRCIAAERIKPDLRTVSARLKYQVLRLVDPSRLSMIKLTTIVAKRA